MTSPTAQPSDKAVKAAVEADDQMTGYERVRHMLIAAMPFLSPLPETTTPQPTEGDMTPLDCQHTNMEAMPVLAELRHILRVPEGECILCVSGDRGAAPPVDIRNHLYTGALTSSNTPIESILTALGVTTLSGRLLGSLERWNKMERQPIGLERRRSIAGFLASELCEVGGAAPPTPEAADPILTQKYIDEEYEAPTEVDPEHPRLSAKAVKAAFDYGLWSLRIAESCQINFHGMLMGNMRRILAAAYAVDFPVSAPSSSPLEAILPNGESVGHRIEHLEKQILRYQEMIDALNEKLSRGVQEEQPAPTPGPWRVSGGPPSQFGGVFREEDDSGRDPNHCYFAGYWPECVAVCDALNRLAVPGTPLP